MKIQISKIIPNPEQPRTDFNPDELESLAESIRQNGLLNPICVTQDGDHYILIDGERRVRAHAMINRSEIEAQVISLNGHNRGLLALAANIQRQDLNPVEIARSIRKLNEEYSNDEIGRMFGRSNNWIWYHLALLDFEPEIQALYAARKLPLDAKTVKALRDLPDDLRVRLAQRFASIGSTSRGIQIACKRYMHGYRPYQRKNFSQGQEKDASGSWDVVLAFDLKVPKISHLRAQKTCKRCVLYEDASRSMCRECPLVMYLKLEMEAEL